MAERTRIERSSDGGIEAVAYDAPAELVPVPGRSANNPVRIPAALAERIAPTGRPVRETTFDYENKVLRYSDNGDPVNPNDRTKITKYFRGLPVFNSPVVTPPPPPPPPPPPQPMRKLGRIGRGIAKATPVGIGATIAKKALPGVVKGASVAQKVATSPLGKAALMAVGAGAVVVAAEKAGALSKLGVPPGTIGKALRGTDASGGPTSTAPTFREWRGGQSFGGSRGRFVSPYDPVRNA